jgi:5-methylcytosine-specific restriction endonuclease McrA
MPNLNIGKCNHCDKEGKINDEKICQSCRKMLKRNPNHICRNKKHEKFVCKCGSTTFHCKDMCKKCYDTSPDRYTSETIEKMCKNRLEKKPVYNRNRGEKRNPDYQPRQDRSDFVCECGSTEHSVGGYCKKCAHRKLGYGQKYEKSHEKERKISRLNNPQWQETARENYSKKMCEKLGMTALEIQMKWRKTKNICLIRDGFTCQVCGYAKYLQVHHIYPKAEYYGLFFDIGTLISLCKKCHDIITYKKFDKK